MAILLTAGSACTPRLYFDPRGDAASDAAGDADGPLANPDGGDAPALDLGGPDAPSVDASVIDVPSVDVPSVDVPSVDVPSVDVPSVDVPSADVPSVDVPSVDVPVVDVVAPGECAPGASRPCFDGPGTADVGRCRAGAQVCGPAGAWPSACGGSVGATTEACGNAVDDDCDGQVDEGCRVLAAFMGCPDAMFASLDLDERFDSATTYATRWSGSHVAPRVADGALTFGPHPLSADWWENYSPTSTRRTYADATLCVHFTFTPTDSGDNTGNLEVSLRGVSEGMVVSVRGSNNDVVLQTKRADGVWVVHATAPLAFARDVPQSVDVLLAAAGDRFRAEVRNASSGAVVALRAQYALPAGPAALLGWMLRNPARVDRVRVGSPSAEVSRVLANPDY